MIMCEAKSNINSEAIEFCSWISYTKYGRIRPYTVVNFFPTAKLILQKPQSINLRGPRDFAIYDLKRTAHSLLKHLMKFFFEHLKNYRLLLAEADEYKKLYFIAIFVLANSLNVLSCSLNAQFHLALLWRGMSRDINHEIPTILDCWKIF